MVTRIVVSVVLAPLFFVILFFLPPVYLAVLMAAICALASYELLRATGVSHHNGLYGFTAAAAAAIPLGQWLGKGALVAGTAAVLLTVTLFYIAIRLYDEERAVRVEDVLLCLFAVVVPVFFFVVLPLGLPGFLALPCCFFTASDTNTSLPFLVPILSLDLHYL